MPRPLSQREVEELERLGIPPDALAGPIPVVSGNVNFDGDRFEFEHHHHRYDEDGVRAFLFLITNKWGEAVDVVAWVPSSGQLATWLRRAFALGEERLYAPRLTESKELPVWRTPLNWLIARRHGICIVRPEAAAHCLADEGPFKAEDFEHLLELKRVLTRPPPRILLDVSHLSLAEEYYENEQLF